jgi:hypothetical protein
VADLHVSVEGATGIDLNGSGDHVALEDAVVPDAHRSFTSEVGIEFPQNGCFVDMESLETGDARFLLDDEFGALNGT